MPRTAVAVVWIVVCAVAFAVLWWFDSTDDVAGLVLAMLVLQLPVFVAIRAPEDKPLAAWRCVAIAVPATIVGAFSSFFVVGTIAVKIFNGPLDFTGLFVGFGAAALGCIGCGAAVGLYLPRHPHPTAARRVMAIFTVAGVVGGAVVMILAQRSEAALGAMMAMTVGWSLPFTLLLWRRDEDPVPVARVR